ncbi:MAG: ABC transporter permease [Patescibacteria group bacterium]|jgi:cell division transport system permease protein|nr:ABC transporter permease [Patescibacteria group bacterium]
MFTALFRIIKYGLQGFKRNSWLSITTIIVMTLALLVFIGLIIFSVLTNKVIGSLKEKIDISVYFNIDTPEDNILAIKRSLESLAEVKSVDYISRDKALEIFKANHQNDQTISEAISILDANPLSASLNIKAGDPKDYQVIAAYLNNDNFKNDISQVSYNQNQVVIDRLTKIIDTVQKSGLALMVILSLVAVLVTLNAIMLAIHSTRDEIGIMRLVGASNMFIRGPYIVQGVLYGVIAAILSIIVIAPAIYFTSPYMEMIMPEINMWPYFLTNLLSLIGYQIGFGILLGTTSSIIAVRKYLKV